MDRLAPATFVLGAGRPFGDIVAQSVDSAGQHVVEMQGAVAGLSARARARREGRLRPGPFVVGDARRERGETADEQLEIVDLEHGRRQHIPHGQPAPLLERAPLGGPHRRCARHRTVRPRLLLALQTTRAQRLDPCIVRKRHRVLRVRQTGGEYTAMDVVSANGMQRGEDECRTAEHRPDGPRRYYRWYHRRWLRLTGAR